MGPARDNHWVPESVMKVKQKTLHEELPEIYAYRFGLCVGKSLCAYSMNINVNIDLNMNINISIYMNMNMNINIIMHICVYQYK